MKRPSFQFYPADWRKDAALQSCSLEAQGLWVNMLCLAHECDPYGHLVVNGSPMTAAQIGRLVGISPKNAEKLLAELLAAGVPSRTENGAFFSRRMVADECLRTRRAEGGVIGGKYGAKGAEHGAKGGRPARQEPPFDGTPRGGGRGVSEPPLKPPPSSSSSSSSSSSKGAPVLLPPTVPGEGRAKDPRAEPENEHENPPVPTPAAQVCIALKGAGVGNVNPSHPDLQVLLAAGATVAEFVAAAEKAKGKRDPYRYVLSTVAATRADAAQLAQQLHQGPLPEPPVTVPSRAADVTAAYLARQTMTEEDRKRADEARRAVMAVRRGSNGAAR